MRGLFVVGALAACGRVDFDPSVPSDATPLARPCGGGSAALDPVSITGVTYRYTSFTNTRAAIPAVTVTAIDDQGGTIGQPVTSDAAGNYRLVVPTGGVARSIEVHYTDANDFATTVHFDAPVDRALTAPGASWFSLGDGPLWSQGSMDSVYSAVSISRDPAKSSISVEAYDCAGMPLDGVTLTVTPPPELFANTGANGLSDLALSTTTLPYTLAVGYNAVPGLTHITASKPGFTFLEQDVVLLAGSNNAIVVIRPVE